jgi:hypothetical protein
MDPPADQTMARGSAKLAGRGETCNSLMRFCMDVAEW